MKKHRRLKIALIVVAALVALVGLGLVGLVQWRLAEEREGDGAIDAPSDFEPIEGSTSRRGRFTAHVEYTSMAAPADAQVSTSVTWDDDWFFADPTVYNHELATTCSVLSAIANSESNYYQAGTGAPAYMENALAELGFEQVSTASYRYRSQIVDEIVNFLTNTNDVVAYTIATKTVTSSETGATKTLFLVSIRGSYGSEWISDANMGDLSNPDLSAGDHAGFAASANEIVSQLQERVTSYAEEGGSTNDVALLFCGHSRGGAVSNLAAAYADDWADSLRPLAERSSIFCYAFAVPRTTTETNCHDAVYANIFNILNPSDMVPRLPLASWGFDRYGQDLWLPAYGSDAFEASYAQMQQNFQGNVGVESPYHPEDVTVVDEFEKRLGEQIATSADFASLGGISSVVKELALDMDVMQVLCGHYPNTYIAWMQAVDEGALSASR